MAINSSPRQRTLRALRLVQDFARDEGGGAPSSAKSNLSVKIGTACLLIVVIAAGLARIAA